MRHSTPPITAGELAERAERRLRKIAALLVFFAGCSQMPPAQRQAADQFACECLCLQPYLGAGLDAAQVLLEVASGKTDLRALLASFGYAFEDYEKLTAEMHSCEPLLASPPAPGDKVL